VQTEAMGLHGAEMLSLPLVLYQIGFCSWQEVTIESSMQLCVPAGTAKILLAGSGSYFCYAVTLNGTLDQREER